MALIRLTKYETVTIASGAALSNAIDVTRYSGMKVFMPDTWTAANIGFYVSHQEDGTYYPLKDKDDAWVEISSPDVDTCYAAPAEVFPAFWLKLWSSDGAGSNTNQAAERTLIVSFKS